MGDYDSGGAGLSLPAILAIGSLLFLYVFVISPLMKWAGENPALFTAMFSTTIITIVLLGMFFLMAKTQESRKSGNAEKGQVSYHSPKLSGIDRIFFGKKQYSSTGNWWKPSGMQDPINIPLEVEEKERNLGLFPYLFYPFIFLFNASNSLKNGILSAFQHEKNQEKIRMGLLEAVIKSINRYKPTDNCIDESGYRTELATWLKKSFPKLNVESYAGQNKPDIVAGKIAIELRRHSDANFADALLEKCPKYSSGYRDLIVLIVEARYKEEKYEKILSGLKNEFDNTVLLLKY